VSEHCEDRCPARAMRHDLNNWGMDGPHHLWKRNEMPRGSRSWPCSCNHRPCMMPNAVAAALPTQRTRVPRSICLSSDDGAPCPRPSQSGLARPPRRAQVMRSMFVLGVRARRSTTPATQLTAAAKSFPYFDFTSPAVTYVRAHALIARDSKKQVSTLTTKKSCPSILPSAHCQFVAITFGVMF
jgi:hypothetical protein